MSNEHDEDVPRHQIRVAARRAGLTVATLRAWERRHGAVRPVRTATARRLYSDADIERLALLRRLAARGHGLGQLVTRSTDELQAMETEERLAGAQTVAGEQRDVRSALAATVLEASEAAVRRQDASELSRLLLRSTVELGPETFLLELLAPLCQRIGSLWKAGAIGVAEEHTSSVPIRQVLGFLLETFRVNESPVTVVVATPQRERHEFGAMMAAALAAAAGARIIYLGADLPIADIVATARRSRAQLVAMSVVHAEDARTLARELEALRDGLADGVEIVIGGGASDAVAAELDRAGVRYCQQLVEWRDIVSGQLAAATAARTS
jgi:methanogenic corrinoid protein MtbC1